MFWTGAQDSTGSDMSPREMGGGAGLLHEALLFGCTGNKNPTEKGPRMPMGFPALEPSAEGFSPITVLLWFRSS